MEAAAAGLQAQRQSRHRTRQAGWRRMSILHASLMRVWRRRRAASCSAAATRSQLEINRRAQRRDAASRRRRRAECTRRTRRTHQEKGGADPGSGGRGKLQPDDGPLCPLPLSGSRALLRQLPDAMLQLRARKEHASLGGATRRTHRGARSLNRQPAGHAAQQRTQHPDAGAGTAGVQRSECREWDALRSARVERKRQRSPQRPG